MASIWSAALFSSSPKTKVPYTVTEAFKSKQELETSLVTVRNNNRTKSSTKRLSGTGTRKLASHYCCHHQHSMSVISNYWRRCSEKKKLGIYWDTSARVHNSNNHGLLPLTACHSPRALNHGWWWYLKFSLWISLVNQSPACYYPISRSKFKPLSVDFTLW